MRTPVFGVRIVCARRATCEPLRQQTVDSTASLCSDEKRYAKMWLNRPFAAAAACKSRARALH
eukprot:8834566-Lingulodinium_polyedra.AAC.1